MHSATIEVLNRVLHGTVNSVVQYIDISAPFIPEGSEKHVETLRRIRDEEGAQAHDLHALIGKLDGNPKVGVFDYWNVDLNYLDLRFMARFAAQHQEKVIADLERDVEAMRDEPAAFGLLTRILQEKRRHLAELRALAPAPEPEPESE